MKIAVAGSTGRVGRHVVDVLNEAGHDVVSMSRASGVDVASGQGLAEALKGVEVVIDASSTPTPDEAAAVAFFTRAAENLQEYGRRAGVKRIVIVSIIGCDKFGTGYMAGKVAHEKTVSAGPIPARILRAAQFHEFVEVLTQWGTQGDVAYLPKMRTQLVAARTVAEALVDLATKGPDSGAILDIAGPREESLPDAAAKLAARRGTPKRVEAVSNPDDPLTSFFESGAALPGPDATLAGPTFEEWLDANYPKSASAAR